MIAVLRRIVGGILGFAARQDSATGCFIFLVLFVVLLTAAMFVGMLFVPIAIAIAIFYGVKFWKRRPVVFAPPDLPRPTLEPPAVAPSAVVGPISDKARALLNEVDAIDGWYACESLAATLSSIIAELYAQESFEAPPQPPATADRIALARYHDEIELWNDKVADPTNIEAFFATLKQVYADFRNALPAMAYTNGATPKPPPGLTVSLLSQIADRDRACNDIVWHFFQPDITQRKLFRPLRAQLDDNAVPLDGKMPIDAKCDDCFGTYFANTPFAQLSSAVIPFEIPDETRFAGMWVIAPQGRGKTTLLHTLVAADVERDAAVILMDSKGDLIEPFLTMAKIRHRLVVIGPDNPIGINPLDIPKTDINKAVDNLEYVFSSLLEFSLTPTQSMLLKSVLRALLTSDIPNPTLETFRDLLANGTKPYAAQMKRIEPDLQDFFAKDFNEDNMRARRREVLQRLRLLLDNDFMRKMLLAPFTTFRIEEAMDSGKFIIIDNSRGKLGDQAAEFFGRFFIAQILAAAQRRSFRKSHEKKPVFFYIDECHTVIARDEKISTILHECRSQNIALIMAHQETAQISSEQVLSALQNCAIRFANPDEEARRLAGPLRTDVALLHGLRRGQFAAYVRDLTKAAVVVNVAKTDFTQFGRVDRPNDEPIVNFNPRPPDMEPWRLDTADAPAAMSDDDFKKAIQERFDILPKPIQDAIQSPAFEQQIRALADKFGLDTKQGEQLENEVVLVLMGFQTADMLPHNLTAVLDLAEATAQPLASDILATVIAPLEQQIASASDSDNATPSASTAAPPPKPGTDTTDSDWATDW